jgi:hypothetical protein
MAILFPLPRIAPVSAGSVFCRVISRDPPSASPILFEQTAKRLGLEYTVHPQGRPRKQHEMG